MTDGVPVWAATPRRRPTSTITPAPSAASAAHTTGATSRPVVGSPAGPGRGAAGGSTWKVGGGTTVEPDASVTGGAELISSDADALPRL
ncbi:MAG TPA: hypothetical protein VID93_10625, partial [Acidimicrobiales bacterium]